MELLIILCLCLLSTTKVTLQGRFAKKHISSFSDGVFFNGIIFLFASLIFVKNAFDFRLPVFMYAFGFGLLTVLFQAVYIKGMSFGNVSLSVLIVNLSMVIPILSSVIVFGEKPTLPKIIGLILTVVTLMLNVDRSEQNKSSKKWFIMSACSFFLNGALAVIQQFFGRTEWKGESGSFVAWSYISATIISVLLYFILMRKKDSKPFNMKFSVLLTGLAIGVVLGTFQFINTKAISEIDGLLLFPAFYGGTIVTSTLSGVLILKDKLKPKQILSIITGVVAIVVMNI